jgi:acyl-coenzyme A thioesterase PaaI-like protein
MTAATSPIATAPTATAKQLAQLDRFPASGWLKTLALRRMVPFLGSAGIVFVDAQPGLASLALPNERKVHNHLRGVHASAAALLAEATSGLLLFYHLPKGRLPLLKRMEVDYTGRMIGGLTATARIDEAAQRAMAEDPNGEVTIDVEIRDAAGGTPLRPSMTWVWRTKNSSAIPT